MKNLFSTIIVIGIIGALWMMLSTQRETLLDDNNNQIQGVDAYMKNFSMSAMDASGKPALILAAVTLEHDTRAEQARLDAPDISILENGIERWRITAREGTIDDHKRFVVLNKDVNIKRKAPDQQVTMSIQADTIALDIDAQIITSDSRVNMISNNMRLASEGLRIDNRSGQLDLLSSVEGYYAQD